MDKNIFIETIYDADAQGHFGSLGGRYVPENLMPALLELERAYETAKNDPAFLSELMGLYQNYSGRPTPLYPARNLSAHLGGARIFIKNEGYARDLFPWIKDNTRLNSIICDDPFMKVLDYDGVNSIKLGEL